MFHDIASDIEIETIKSSAKTNLNRSVVYVPETESQERISRNVRFDETDSELFERLTQRIEDATGLILKISESYEAQNYGIMGYSDLHSDYFNGEDTFNKFMNNGSWRRGYRFATFLLYVSFN